MFKFKLYATFSCSMSDDFEERNTDFSRGASHEQFSTIFPEQMQQTSLPQTSLPQTALPQTSLPPTALPPPVDDIKKECSDEHLYTNGDDSTAATQDQVQTETKPGGLEPGYSTTKLYPLPPPKNMLSIFPEHMRSAYRREHTKVDVEAANHYTSEEEEDMEEAPYKTSYHEQCDSLYRERSEFPYNERSDVPYSGHSDVSYNERSDVPYGEHRDVPYGERSDMSYNERSDVPYLEPVSPADDTEVGDGGEVY